MSTVSCLHWLKFCPTLCFGAVCMRPISGIAYLIDNMEAPGRKERCTVQDERKGLQDGTHCKLVAQKQLQNSQPPRAPEKIKAVPKRCLPYSLGLHPAHAEGSQKTAEEE